MAPEDDRSRIDVFTLLHDMTANAEQAYQLWQAAKETNDFNLIEHCREQASERDHELAEMIFERRDDLLDTHRRVEEQRDQMLDRVRSLNDRLAQAKDQVEQLRDERDRSLSKAEELRQQLEQERQRGDEGMSY